MRYLQKEFSDLFHVVLLVTFNRLAVRQTVCFSSQSPLLIWLKHCSLRLHMVEVRARRHNALCTDEVAVARRLSSSSTILCTGSVNAISLL